MSGEESRVASPIKRPKSPEVLKQLRKSTRSSFTKLVNKIDQKIKDKCSSETITLIRENVNELMNKCLNYHSRYVDVAGLAGDQLDDAHAWAQKVDDVARNALATIDNYLDSLETQQPRPTELPKDLLEAKRKREEAEVALLEAEREAGEKRRKLEFEVQQTRLEESALEKSIDADKRPLLSSTPNAGAGGSNNIGFSHPGAQGSGYHYTQQGQSPSNSAPGWLSSLLPKMELPTFNGDPRLWRSFSRSFKELVHDSAPSDAQRIVVLRQMLTPEVRYGLEQMLRNPDNYQKVLQELHNRYGDQYIILRAYLHSLQRIRSCRDGDYGSLRDLAAQLHDVVCGLQDENCIQMCSGSSLELVIDKMPADLRSKWGIFAFRNRPKMLTLVDLDTWLQERMIGESWVRPTYDNRNKNSSKRGDAPAVLATFPAPAEQTNFQPRTNDNVEHQQRGGAATWKCLICGAAGHPLHECGGFVEASPDDRVKMVMREGNCFRCLGRQHLSVDCKKNVNCSVRGCNRKHHPLLHGGAMPSDPGKKAVGTPRLTGANAEQCLTTTAPRRRRQTVLLHVVPALVRFKEKIARVFVLLDNGSQVTLIDKKFAQTLGMDGEEETLRLSTFHGDDPDFNVLRVGFDIMINEIDYIAVEDGLVVPHLNVASCPVDWTQEKKKWSHLTDLDLPRIAAQPISILVGMDVPEVHVALEIRKPSNGIKGPYGLKTILGWAAVGCLPRFPPPLRAGCHTQALEDLLIAFFETDTRCHPIRELSLQLSPEDRRARSILERTTLDVGGRYEVGMLWKEDHFNIPNNRPLALQRLFSNEQRFKEDTEYAAQYTRIMKEYVDLGFAKKLDIADLNGPPGRTNYLIHFGVQNPNKPGKLRVVFHAALKYKGVALNDLLSAGPDLLTSLVGVLIRFRTSTFGISGDIEKMFLQVKVPMVDQPMLRFVWREPNSGQAPCTYQMGVHIFGATSSPTCCTWALRQAAKDQPNYDLEKKVLRNFYVDNYLDSFDNENEAADCREKMTEMLANKGFKLNQWCSSSRGVLTSIPNQERTHSKLDIDLDRLPVERTLGILWDCERDAFNFFFKEPREVTTKREMFSAAATVFDPLGCVAPIILPVKILMQDIWRQGIRWDQTLPSELLKVWGVWCSGLLELSKLFIPRCFRPPSFADSRIELHIFSDASKDGYGAVGYFRYWKEESCHVSFVLAKSRVAPVRQQTIPKLELNGAWTAVELARTIRQEFDQTIYETKYWTDSTTVLHWINAGRAKHPEFIANRVTHILEHSSVGQWNHVPGALNPADDCSRGLKPAQLGADHRWFCGPQFLQLPADHWPDQTVWRRSEVTDSEVKLAGCVHATSAPQTSADAAVEAAIMDVTSLDELKTRVAAGLSDQGGLTVESRRGALVECVRAAQIAFYPGDISALLSGQPLPKRSRLTKLNPFLDEKGLLRVGGRLEHAELEFDARFPWIVPHDHPLARLIVLDAHEIVRHAGKVRTLSEVRNRFWITKGLATVSKHIKSCVTCSIDRAKSSPPLMSPLPSHRLQPYLPPFTNTGIDYFGPFHVVVGRRQEKRYGVLFTCLTTRAVHLEMANYLTSDSFILAFRRFVGRRGAPSVVYSDNGTNLCAGEKEMREAIRVINADTSLEAKRKDIEWHFSPPSAPHFGGVWERLVRSSKRALEHVLRGQSVSDEILHTAFIEVESLLNGRPLTHVSVDPKDPTPLTPNHFLTGRPHPNLPIAVISPKERLSSKSWRRAQQIVDQFWKRWLREYVPALTERIKWTRQERNLQVGDLVLMADKANERGTWPVGRVTKVMPGRDGVVRTAVVKTKHGEYTRPAIKLFVFRETSADVP